MAGCSDHHSTSAPRGFGPAEHRVPALAQRLGIETFDQYRDGDAIIDDLTGVQRYPGNPIDVPAHRIIGGTASLAAALADQLPPGTIHFEQPVLEITDDLSVVTNDRVWQADHVVIALPPALAVRTIKLPSQLPPELIDVASRTPVWMGDSVKVVALFSEPFWRRDGFAGAAMSRRGPLAEIHDMSGPGGEPAALFGFARAASMHPDIETDIRKQLTRMFGPGPRHQSTCSSRTGVSSLGPRHRAKADPPNTACSAIRCTDSQPWEAGCTGHRPKQRRPSPATLKGRWRQPSAQWPPWLNHPVNDVKKQ